MSFWMPSADTSATMRFQEERAVKVPEELKKPLRRRAQKKAKDIEAELAARRPVELQHPSRDAASEVAPGTSSQKIEQLLQMMNDVAFVVQTNQQELAQIVRIVREDTREEVGDLWAELRRPTDPSQLPADADAMLSWQPPPELDASPGTRIERAESAFDLRQQEAEQLAAELAAREAELERMGLVPGLV